MIGMQKKTQRVDKIKRGKVFCRTSYKGNVVGVRQLKKKDIRFSTKSENIYIDVKNILEDGWFAHDINNPLKREVLENMLQYFMDIEDYEKCHDIKNVLDNWTKNKYRKI